MSYNDLVRLYFDRSNALQWYWTLYVIVVGGLLAFSSLRQRKDTLTAGLVTVLFMFFCVQKSWRNQRCFARALRDPFGNQGILTSEFGSEPAGSETGP
jgi:hypothetical protein